MKLSEFKGERAIEVFGDLLEPVAEILTDKEIVAMIQSDNVNQILIMKKLLKEHSKSILWILAILDEQEPETYSPSFIEIPKKIIELLNDKTVKDLFISQSPEESKLSGSATENIEAKEN